MYNVMAPMQKSMHAILTVMLCIIDPTPMQSVAAPMLRRSLVYKDLDVGMDTVTVKWRGDNCSMFFEAQGYTIIHLQDGHSGKSYLGEFRYC
jgi:hypothetical protein